MSVSKPGIELYVANTSKQHQTIYYFVRELGYRPIYLQPGAQDLVGRRRLDDFELEKTLKGWAPYRFLNATELKSARHYVGVCYSIGKPVSVDDMLAQYERNDEELNEHSSQRLEQTVAAMSHQMEKEIQGPVQHLTAEIVEVGTVQQPDSVSAPRVAKAIEAVAEGVTPRHSGKRGRISA